MTQNVSGWLPNLIGPVALADEGTAVPARPTINFTGAGVTATDNPGQNRTDITIAGGGGGTSTLPVKVTRVSKGANYTIVSGTDYLIECRGAFGFTITLPAAPADTETYIIKNNIASGGSNTVAGGGHSIDGSANYTLAPGAAITVVYDLTNTDWVVI